MQALLDAYATTGELLDELELPKREAFPTETLPIVTGDKLVPAHWGLVPFWSKDTKSASKMINARGETITEMPAFRDSVRKRRCLVPVTGWHEWHLTRKYVFETGALMSFAGIYSWNKTLALRSFSIITTEANAVVKPYHQKNRMPVLLGEHQFEMWLDPESPLEEITGALKPYGGNDLLVRPVLEQREDSVQGDLFGS